MGMVSLMAGVRCVQFFWVNDLLRDGMESEVE